MLQRTGIAVAVFVATGFIVTSCCSVTSVDSNLGMSRLDMIGKLRTEEKQLNSDIEKSRGEEKKITAELNARQEETRKCNETRSFIQDKINNWSRAFPNFDPNAPDPEPQAPPAPPTKKRR